ncbi:MAG: hypothetical protein LBC93_00735 [Synergistaceae bacterium]|nr:hypothetical protein [Synergistaceae bacterium]
MNAESWQRIADYEAPAMRKKFPQFKLFQGNSKLPFAQNGETFWGGNLRTNFGTEYSVAVVYPRNYPHGQIKSFVRELMTTATPHKYVDGHLCLYSNDHDCGGDGIGTETTASTIVAWTAAWLNAWEVFQRRGAWPGRE